MLCKLYNKQCFSAISKIFFKYYIYNFPVIVRAYPETPLVDLDSILFLDNGAKALGKVFDVFGPVSN